MADPLTGNLTDAEGSRADGGWVGTFDGPGVDEAGDGAGEGSDDGPGLGLVEEDGTRGGEVDGAGIVATDGGAGSCDGCGEFGGLAQPLASDMQISDVARSLAIRGTLRPV